MARTMETGGQVLQTWLPTPVATELRQDAAREGVSISSTIRGAIERDLHTTSPDTGEDRREAGIPRSPADAPGLKRGQNK